MKYATEDSLKWDLPQHFKTRTQKRDYSRLLVKRSSMTHFAIEEFTAFISEQVDLLPGSENATRRTYRGEDLEGPEAIRVFKPRTREGKTPRTLSPKYFCQNCKADLCRDCFKVCIKLYIFILRIYSLLSTMIEMILLRLPVSHMTSSGWATNIFNVPFRYTVSDNKGSIHDFHSWKMCNGWCHWVNLALFRQELRK